MKITIDVKDSKAEFLMELLENLSFVKKAKATKSNPEKERILKNIKLAVEELNLIKAGKKKGRSVWELIDEL